MSKRRQWFASAALFLFLFIIDDDVQPLIAAQEKAVEDVYGNELQTRKYYIVVSDLGEEGLGWLKPERMNGTINVMLFEGRSVHGYDRYPVTFIPDRKTLTIYESTNLTVRFDFLNTNRGFWIPDGEGYVKVDIIDKLPSQSWFRIVEAGIPNRYKFVYCRASAACVDVGITVEDGRSWLSLYGKPFEFFLD